jgi:hypothetical protein
MPMPKSRRRMKKAVKLGAKPHSNSTVEKKMTLAIRGRRRP